MGGLWHCFTHIKHHEKATLGSGAHAPCGRAAAVGRTGETGQPARQGRTGSHELRLVPVD